MAELFRVLSAPVQPGGDASAGELAALVSADAVCRWARSRGFDVHWAPAAVAGGLAGQHAAERDLARAGFDRRSLAQEEFVARVREHEADERARLTGLLRSLGVDADLDAHTTEREEVAQAGRTAFVRLFEEGRIVHDERIVQLCTRCGTVVDAADAEPAELPVEATVAHLAVDGHEPIEVRLVAPELLAGAVAVVVPGDDQRVGLHAEVPLAGAVPVLAGNVEGAAVLTPAHDAAALDVARQAGLAPVVVLDAGGCVVVDGPLEGLSRFAARQAAVDYLEAAGVVSGREAAVEAAARCRRCGSVLVPRLGRHWFLAMADLEVAAADAVRQGDVDIAPVGRRDEFLARAGQSGDWCLSHQVSAGQPVPVSRCLDCGKVAVSVEASGSCGTCMGTLDADPSVLDARFVATVAALVDSGWPAAPNGPAATSVCTMFLTASGGMAEWALPIAALGLRLAGAVPFSRLAVHEDVVATMADVDDAQAEAGDAPALARFLLATGLPLVEARDALASIAQPVEGDADATVAEREFDAAMSSGLAGDAGLALASVARTGVPAESASRLRRMAAPLLGE